jgi:hypothetical protein
MGRATFWANYLQTHLVTLPIIPTQMLEGFISDSFSSITVRLNSLKLKNIGQFLP